MVFSAFLIILLTTQIYGIKEQIVYKIEGRCYVAALSDTSKDGTENNSTVKLYVTGKYSGPQDKYLSRFACPLHDTWQLTLKAPKLPTLQDYWLEYRQNQTKFFGGNHQKKRTRSEEVKSTSNIAGKHERNKRTVKKEPSNTLRRRLQRLTQRLAAGNLTDAEVRRSGGSVLLRVHPYPSNLFARNDTNRFRHYTAFYNELHGNGTISSSLRNISHGPHDESSSDQVLNRYSLRVRGSQDDRKSNRPLRRQVVQGIPANYTQQMYRSGARQGPVRLHSNVPEYVHQEGGGPTQMLQIPDSIIRDGQIFYRHDVPNPDDEMEKSKIGGTDTPYSVIDQVSQPVEDNSIIYSQAQGSSGKEGTFHAEAESHGINGELTHSAASGDVNGAQAQSSALSVNHQVIAQASIASRGGINSLDTPVIEPISLPAEEIQDMMRRSGFTGFAMAAVRARKKGQNNISFPPIEHVISGISEAHPNNGASEAIKDDMVDNIVEEVYSQSREFIDDGGLQGGAGQAHLESEFQQIPSYELPEGRSNDTAVGGLVGFTSYSQTAHEHAPFDDIHYPDLSDLSKYNFNPPSHLQEYDEYTLETPDGNFHYKHQVNTSDDYKLRMHEVTSSYPLYQDKAVPRAPPYEDGKSFGNQHPTERIESAVKDNLNISLHYLGNEVETEDGSGHENVNKNGFMQRKVSDNGSTQQIFESTTHLPHEIELNNAYKQKFSGGDREHTDGQPAYNSEYEYYRQRGYHYQGSEGDLVNAPGFGNVNEYPRIRENRPFERDEDDNYNVSGTFQSNYLDNYSNGQQIGDNNITDHLASGQNTEHIHGYVLPSVYQSELQNIHADQTGDPYYEYDDDNNPYRHSTESHPQQTVYSSRHHYTYQQSHGSLRGTGSNTELTLVQMPTQSRPVQTPTLLPTVLTTPTTIVSYPDFKSPLFDNSVINSPPHQFYEQSFMNEKFPMPSVAVLPVEPPNPPDFIENRRKEKTSEDAHLSASQGVVEPVQVLRPGGPGSMQFLPSSDPQISEVKVVMAEAPSTMNFPKRMGKTILAGEKIPGTRGYTVPSGFRGRLILDNLNQIPNSAMQLSSQTQVYPLSDDANRIARQMASSSASSSAAGVAVSSSSSASISANGTLRSSSSSVSTGHYPQTNATLLYSYRQTSSNSQPSEGPNYIVGPNEDQQHRPTLTTKTWSSWRSRSWSGRKPNEGQVSSESSGYRSRGDCGYWSIKCKIVQSPVRSSEICIPTHTVLPCCC